jgi:hypothetical protein
LWGHMAVAAVRHRSLRNMILLKRILFQNNGLQPEEQASQVDSTQDRCRERVVLKLKREALVGAMWKEAARQCIEAVSTKEKAQQPNGGST